MEILLSKRKLRRNLIGCVVFILLSVWMIIEQVMSDDPLLEHQSVYYFVGGMGILFFGFCAYYYIRKLRDVKPGLVIDDQGITDNSSAFPLGFIPWEDIRSLATITVKRQKFLVIGIGNPQVYIEREKGLKKTTLQYNYRFYGSPFIIWAGSLNCTLEELKAAIEQKMNDRRLNEGGR